MLENSPTAGINMIDSPLATGVRIGSRGTRFNTGDGIEMARDRRLAVGN